MERFLEPCLLMLLLKAPAHGYELLGRFAEFGLDPEQQDPVFSTGPCAVWRRKVT